MTSVLLGYYWSANPLSLRRTRSCQGPRIAMESIRATYGLHSRHRARRASPPKLQYTHLGMMAKAAVLEPHLTLKVVNARQHSKSRDSLCQSGANSKGNLLKTTGVAKYVTLSRITVSWWRVHHLTACFGGEVCDGLPPKGFLYKTPAQHSDKQLVSEGSVYFWVNSSPLEVMERFEKFILRRK